MVDAKDITNTPFATLRDAVNRTGLSYNYLRKGCADGTIPCVKNGRRVFVNVDALLRQTGAKL